LCGFNFLGRRRSASRPPRDADRIAYNKSASVAALEREGLPQRKHARVDRRAARTLTAVEAALRWVAEKRADLGRVFGAAMMRRRLGGGARDGLDWAEYEKCRNAEAVRRISGSVGSRPP